MPKTLQHKVSFRSWGVAKALVKRAEHAGGGQKPGHLGSARRTDPRQCASCHEPGLQGGSPCNSAAYALSKSSRRPSCAGRPEKARVARAV